MEREERESDKVRAQVIAKRTEMGLRLTRHLSLAEGREFLATGRAPAEAIGASTFVCAKRLESLPAGSACMVCGKDLSGQAGLIVEIAAPSGKVFKTICEADYETITGAKARPAPAESEASAPASPAQAAQEPVKDGGGDAVSTALAALTAALKQPKAKPIDEAALIAEAVRNAKEAAKEEAKGFMQKSIADFIRDGGATATAAAADGGEPATAAAAMPSAAKGDGVAQAEKASSWSAKATAPAKDAVEKLNKFLSEFSYFRDGVSMRLINTFSRAGNANEKKAVLSSYCEVSQMEDLPDLIEKMKSPEFGEVVKAFDAIGKIPKSLNRRFAVFYGAPGGGKTYAAEEAAKKINGDGKCEVVPCSAGMDASDMLYAYRLDYATGKRGYVPTGLLNAMLAGRAVVLDEVNLLPMEARMFLQNILDNKQKVSVMGVEIPIRDGFFVIGTMNPDTGLGATPLPLPLVDRAAVVREFKTTSSQAAVGAGLC